MNNDINDSAVFYDSYKEARDLVLEYNQVKLDDVRAVNIMGMGIDNITMPQAIVSVMHMIKEGGVHHILSLTPYKLIRFKSSDDLNLIYHKADLKIASGAGLEWAARKHRTQLKERIPLLSFIMELIRIAEIKEYSIFIVGGRPEVAEKTFFNIRKSFPKIRIVGRHGGFFSEDRERSVIEAIRKSEANIVLVGLGFPLEDRWINTVRNQFRNTVFIGVGGCFDIISGETHRAPEYFISRGLDWFYRDLLRPWRWGA
jgi:N-acetylglucosaminyldiphosphoundecaprenol N-acetyl-beta-D-mannosaminyltransferase